jgi:hypothetical protein
MRLGVRWSLRCRRCGDPSGFERRPVGRVPCVHGDPEPEAAPAATGHCLYRTPAPFGARWLCCVFEGVVSLSGERPDRRGFSGAGGLGTTRTFGCGGWSVPAACRIPSRSPGRRLQGHPGIQARGRSAGERSSLGSSRSQGSGCGLRGLRALSGALGQASQPGAHRCLERSGAWSVCVSPNERAPSGGLEAGHRWNRQVEHPRALCGQGKHSTGARASCRPGSSIKCIRRHPECPGRRLLRREGSLFGSFWNRRKGRGLRGSEAFGHSGSVAGPRCSMVTRLPHPAAERCTTGDLVVLGRACASRRRSGWDPTLDACPLESSTLWVLRCVPDGCSGLACQAGRSSGSAVNPCR